MHNNPISLGKIISSSVNIISSIKKIIPIYEDIRPLLNKLSNLNNTLKKGKLPTRSFNKETQKKEEETTIYSSPQFFL